MTAKKAILVPLERARAASPGLALLALPAICKTVRPESVHLSSFLAHQLQDVHQGLNFPRTDTVFTCNSGSQVPFCKMRNGTYVGQRVELWPIAFSLASLASLNWRNEPAQVGCVTAVQTARTARTRRNGEQSDNWPGMRSQARCS